ncbi:hypothetical protein [Bradyrhizobium sp. STM 3557]|uniref:hypothetical protein n=1 Tax=Bradyrhizobium sp. STM 3557 TaxID=578920 RepID=UPI00388F3F9E
MTDAALLQSASSDRLASVLGCGISSTLVDQLVHTPRFRDRLFGLVLRRLGEVGCLSREQAKMLAMQPDQLIELSRRAGSVWHAGSIIRIIDGASRRLLISLLGERNYALALVRAEARPPGVTVDLTPEDIAKAVAIDGAACLAEWCEQQPWAVCGRLRLKRPAAAPDSVHRTWGPQIIAHLLAD